MTDHMDIEQVTSTPFSLHEVTIVITTKNNDGIAAAAVLRYFYPGVKILFLNPNFYKEEFEDLLLKGSFKNQKVVMTDITFANNDMQKLLVETGGQLFVIDHHVNEENVKGIAHYSNVDHCAAVNTWKMYSTEEVPNLLAYVEDHDIRPDNRNYPDSKKIADYLRYQSMATTDIDEILCIFIKYFDDDEFDELRETGIGFFQDMMDTFVKSSLRSMYMRLCDVGGDYYLIGHAFDTTIQQTEIGMRMLREYPFLDTACIFWKKLPTGELVAARSTANGPPALKVAKAFGGGGHPCACGFTVSDMTIGTCLDNGEVYRILKSAEHDTIDEFYIMVIDIDSIKDNDDLQTFLTKYLFQKYTKIVQEGRNWVDSSETTQFATAKFRVKEPEFNKEINILVMKYTEDGKQQIRVEAPGFEGNRLALYAKLCEKFGVERTAGSFCTIC